MRERDQADLLRIEQLDQARCTNGALERAAEEHVRRRCVLQLELVSADLARHRVVGMTIAGVEHEVSHERLVFHDRHIGLR